MLLSLRSRVAWAHDWVTDPTLNAVFQTLGTSFVVNGAAPAQDSVLASAGAELYITRNISVDGKFDGEFARNSQSYAGRGAVRVRW
jgi:uncharacterized protein with beta-barrel porin domain